MALAAVCAVSLALSPAERPTTAPSYRQSTAADTLRYSVRAGQPLIVALPARFEGGEAQYEIIEAPALSWLVDRSFLWRTVDGERGTFPVRFLRRTPGGAPDTLVLVVEIEP